MLIYYGFDLVRRCNFKDFWLPVKQVLYINKKLNHSHAFSFFRLFSFSAFLLSHVCFSTSLLHLLVAASLKKTLKSLIPHLRRKPTKPSEPSAPTNPQSPTHSQPQIEGASSHPIHSSALLSSLFSSNPYSNQRRTHIQSNSAALHLFPDDSAALLLFHSKSVAPPTIFRFSLYI